MGTLRSLLNPELRILLTIGCILVFSILRGIIGSIINKNVKDLRRKYLTRQTINYLMTILFVAAMGFIWITKVGSVVTFLSLVLSALILVSKELVINIVASLVIVWRGLFVVGDRVQIGTNIGDVMDTGAMYITLAEHESWDKGGDPTGRVIKIPNSVILTAPVANYSTGLSLVWHEINISVKQNTNWKKARENAIEAAKSVAYKLSDRDWDVIRRNFEEMIFHKDDVTSLISYENSVVKILVRYPVKLDKRRESENNFWANFLDKTSLDNDIELS
jgi:small-conductance mechanosensitive channel